MVRAYDVCECGHYWFKHIDPDVECRACDDCSGFSLVPGEWMWSWSAQ